MQQAEKSTTPSHDISPDYQLPSGHDPSQHTSKRHKTTSPTETKHIPKTKKPLR